VTNELHNLPVNCRDSELNRFTSPPGQTCGEYMQAFFADGGPGYLVNNATSDCAYCAYSIGDQFFKPFGMEYEHRWRDFGILTAFIGSNLIFLFLGSRYLNYNRR
jgi:ABC-type multidrug transport system permease subunit